MAHGLDIGPEGLRLASGDPSTPEVVTEPAIRCVTDEAALTTVGIDTTAAVSTDEGLLVGGHDAVAVADVTTQSTAPIFDAAPLSSADEHLLEALIEDLIATTEGRVCVTTLGRLVSPTGDWRERIDDLVTDVATEATPISKGFATIYHQLEDDNLTGLGVCIEEHTTSVTLAYYGVPVMAFTIDKGGAWITAEAAGETGHAQSQVRSRLESFVLEPDAASGGIESALAAAHDALAMELIDTIRTEADESDVREGLAVPVAVGGPCAPEGIEFLLGGRFDAASLPFSIRGVRRAGDPASSAAVGALAAAIDDVDDFDTSQGSPLDAQGSDPEEPSLSLERTDPDPESGTDAAIEKLFDRLANRDEEITAVADRVDDIVADLEGLEAAVDDAATATRVEEQVAGLRSELATLEDDSATADRVADIDERLSTLGSDLEAIEAAVDEVDAALASLEERGQAVRQSLEADLEDIAADLTDVAERGTAERADLSDDVADLEADLDQSASERAALDAITDELASDLEALADDVASLTGSLDDLANRTETLEGSMDALEADLETLADETVRAPPVEAIARGVSVVAGESRDMAERLAALETGLADRIDEEIDGLEAAIETLETEGLAAVEEQLEAVDSELDDATDTLGTATDRIETLEGTTDDLTADLAETDETVASLDSHIDTVGDDVADVTDDLDEVQIRVDDIQEDLAADLEALSARLEGLEDDSVVEETLTTEVERLEDELASEDAVEAVAEEVDELVSEERVETIADDIETLEATLEDLDGTLRETVTDLEAELDTTVEADRVEALAETVDSLQDLAHSVGEDLDTLSRDVRTLESDHAKGTERLDRLTKSLATVDRRTADVDQLKNQVADAAAADRVASLSATLEELQERLDAAEDAFATAERVATIEDEVPETGPLEDELEATGDRLETVEEILVDADQVEAVATDVDDLASDLSSVTERLDVVESATADHASEDTLAAEIERLEGTIASLESDLDEAVAVDRFDTVEGDLATLEERVDDLATDSSGPSVTDLPIPLLAGAGAGAAVTGGIVFLRIDEEVGLLAAGGGGGLLALVILGTLLWSYVATRE